MISKKKLYITGIYGMLGARIALALKTKYQVFGCDNASGFKLTAANVFYLDLTDFDKIADNLRYIKPDIVIHTAAMIDLEECEKHPEKAQLMNTDVTRNLSLICSEIHARFVYISTDAVFDGKKETLYSEEDRTCPINVYGESKLYGEKSVQELLNDFLILRTNIFGWNLQNKSSFAEWIYNTLSVNKSISMFNDVFFTPIYTGNFSDALDELISGDARGTFHLAGAEKLSKLDFGLKMAKVFHFNENLIRQSSVDQFQFSAKRAKNMSLDTGKIKKILKVPLPDVFDGISQFKKEIGIFQE